MASQKIPTGLITGWWMRSVHCTANDQPDGHGEFPTPFIMTSCSTTLPRQCFAPSAGQARTPAVLGALAEFFVGLCIDSNTPMKVNAAKGLVSAGGPCRSLGMCHALYSLRHAKTNGDGKQ